MPAPEWPSIDNDGFARRLDASRGDPAPAWKALLAQWSIPAEGMAASTASPCPALKAPDLFCADGRQRLSLLAQFDRPMLLRLHHGAHPAWAVLVGLGSTQALLQLDGERFVVRRVTLEGMLDGYAMIARKPPGLVLPIRRGDGGFGADWLRGRVAASNAAPSGTVDEALMDAVRTRQRDFGLHPDGVVGPETAFALMADDRDGPHLRKLPE